MLDLLRVPLILASFGVLGFSPVAAEAQATARGAGAEGNSDRPGAPAYFVGRVIEVRDAQQGDAGPRPRVALFETTSGERFLVDLGPAGNARVERGDRLRVSGRFRRAGSRQVLVAERYATGNGTVTVDRKRRGTEDTGAQVSLPDSDKGQGAQGGYVLRSTSRQVTGRIDQVRKVGVRGGAAENLVARVVTPKERKVYVDLGPASDLGHIGFREGDEITALGRDALVDGRPVLIAFQIESDGERIEVDREGQIYRSGERFTGAGGERPGTRD